jgi:antitoxin component HigA of HigAB toxin-antitoxin module
MRTLNKNRTIDRYFELVRSFPLRHLKSNAQHANAKEIYLRLSSDKPDSGTRDYLEVLADLIAEYEKRTGQIIDTSDMTAAEIVRHRLEERGMSISALAGKIGIAQPNLSEMLNGRRAWSKAAIRGIASLFNIRAERFLT